MITLRMTIPLDLLILRASFPRFWFELAGMAVSLTPEEWYNIPIPRGKVGLLCDT
ncbi:MAG TPA: hypothetical protein GX393_00875 [Firmicutes bacterium]|jgi:hypothetical protein|nr:hypothetical protein [Bacillota bacterium]